MKESFKLKHVCETCVQVIIFCDKSCVKTINSSIKPTFDNSQGHMQGRNFSPHKAYKWTIIINVHCYAKVGCFHLVLTWICI
jgi:hypothetical protein